VLDNILGPGRYDARIRPSGENGTGEYRDTRASFTLIPPSILTMYRDNVTKKSRGESAAKWKRRVEQRKKGRGTEGKARAVRHTLRAARRVRKPIESGKSKAREPIDHACASGESRSGRLILTSLG